MNEHSVLQLTETQYVLISVSINGQKKILKISRYGTVTVLVYNVYYLAQTYCSSLKESILCNVCLLDGLLS